MTDADTLAAFERIVRAAVRDELSRLLVRDLTPQQRGVGEAVVRLYAGNEAFTTAEVLQAARFDPDARAALRRHCGDDVQRLGIILRQLADAGAVIAGYRVVRLPPEAGSRRWTLEATQPR